MNDEFDFLALRLVTPLLERFVLGRIDTACPFAAFLAGRPAFVMRDDVYVFLAGHDVVLSVS